MISYEKQIVGYAIDKQGRKIQFRASNCLCVAIRPFKEDGKFWHQLCFFIADEKHAKNLTDIMPELLKDIRFIKLDLSYKENYKVLKYFVEAGAKVTCYYTKPF